MCVFECVTYRLQLSCDLLEKKKKEKKNLNLVFLVSSVAPDAQDYPYCTTSSQTMITERAALCSDCVCVCVFVVHFSSQFKRSQSSSFTPTIKQRAKNNRTHHNYKFFLCLCLLSNGWVTSTSSLNMKT